MAKQETLLAKGALLIVALILPRLVFAAEVVGVSVIPHRIEPTLRYRRPRDEQLGARVQVFVRGRVGSPRFGGKAPADWLAAKEWAWHDVGSAPAAQADDELAVWTFNARGNRWGVGAAFDVAGEGLAPHNIAITKPARFVASATFLGPAPTPLPDTIVLHLTNDGARPMALKELRVWLPDNPKAWNSLRLKRTLPLSTVMDGKEKGFVRLATEPLPLTYCALELVTDSEPLWASLRIKRETFDISGGWIGEGLTQEPYLKLLRGLHVNTGQIENVPGYTDNSQLYAKYPIKLFNRLWPLEQWDTDVWLPRIHAVEFLGEPQYGGGRPVAPQEVFDKLLPYRVSRLATSVTHSEERIWREYAGLSDYPHYDAYRVVAPSADSWGLYDRWDGRRLRWGAPLETIGDLSRSLRDLNRPLACAYWSQGPHDGWQGGWDGRKRRSPTPDEIRAQALHALSTRITSLYWFNLSQKSLKKYPDTWEAIRRVGREIAMLSPFYLEGSEYRFERRRTPEGQPDWDLTTLSAPEAAVLFALDTAYRPDEKESVFVFGPARPTTFVFALPPWLRQPKDVFRVDADGATEVAWKGTPAGVEITGKFSRDAIFVATSRQMLRSEIEQRRRQALAVEVAAMVVPKE